MVFIRLVTAVGMNGRGRGGAAPRPASLPTLSDEERGLRLQLTQHLAEQRAMFSRLMHTVGTIDTLVYEHDTQQLPPTASTFSFTLQPQTSQTEYIRAVFCSIVQPSAAAAAAINITNAWAKLGNDYINLQALLSPTSGTGGSLSGDLCLILGSDSDRKVSVTAAANFPPNALLTFSLFGEAVPTMDGGVLH